MADSVQRMRGIRGRSEKRGWSQRPYRTRPLVNTQTGLCPGDPAHHDSVQGQQSDKRTDPDREEREDFLEQRTTGGAYVSG